MDTCLCFVFVARTELIAHLCFGYCFIPWNASFPISNRLRLDLRLGVDKGKTGNLYH